MQEPTFFAGKPTSMPAPNSQMQQASSRLRSKLVLVLVPVLVIALVAGSLTWLQWASQRGITLGYPAPQVHIEPLASGTALLNANIQFSADVTGRDLNYSWDFGDGTYDSGPIVSHAYQQLSGEQNNFTYTVSVSVTDPLGRSSSDATTIRVLPPLPTVTFTYSEETGYYGYDQTIDFNTSGSVIGTSTATYSWTFGDGNSDPNGSSTETYTYYSPGTYVVTLVITDEAGQTGQSQETITVQ